MSRLSHPYVTDSITNAMSMESLAQAGIGGSRSTIFGNLVVIWLYCIGDDEVFSDALAVTVRARFHLRISTKSTTVVVYGSPYAIARGRIRNKIHNGHRNKIQHMVIGPLNYGIEFPIQ